MMSHDNTNLLIYSLAALLCLAAACASSPGPGAAEPQDHPAAMDDSAGSDLAEPASDEPEPAMEGDEAGADEAEGDEDGADEDGMMLMGKKDKWQQGTACVKANAPTDKCPKENRGVCRTGRADGCKHDNCTTAKNNARASLRNAVPSGCHAYIESTSRCENGPGCK